MFTCKNKGISLLNLDNTLILMKLHEGKIPSNGNRSVFVFLISILIRVLAVHVSRYLQWLNIFWHWNYMWNLIVTIHAFQWKFAETVFCNAGILCSPEPEHGFKTFCPIDCIEETCQNYFIDVHSPLSPSSLPLTAANRVVTLFDILKKLSLWEGVTSINMDIDVLLLS